MTTAGALCVTSTDPLRPPAPPGPAAAAAPVYFPWFDWLRIVLASTVLLFHAQVLPWSQAGNLAVQVFFALSGWLIGGILIETEPRGLSRFWFNRATRIWIPYAAASLLLLGLAAARDTITRKWIEFVFYKITFTFNVFGLSQMQYVMQMPLQGTAAHFWSICAEEQFYLAAPLLLVLAPRRVGRSPWTWGAIAAVAVAANVYGAITLGVLAAVLHQRFGAWYRGRSAQATIVLCGIAAGVGMAWDACYRYTVPLFSIAVVLLLAREGRKQAIGTFLGGVSYPLYLNHWTGLFVAHWLGKRVALAPGILGALALCLSFAHATVMFVAIDRQVMARRSRWFSRRRGWVLAGVGFGLVAIGFAVGLALHA